MGCLFPLSEALFGFAKNSAASMFTPMLSVDSVVFVVV